jgi:hypothetical protein
MTTLYLCCISIYYINIFFTGEIFMPRKGYTWPEERKQSSHYADFLEFAKQKKSDEHRRAMSDAKKGVPKTEEHREALSCAHKERWELFRKFKESNPDLSNNEVWNMVKEERA